MKDLLDKLTQLENQQVQKPTSLFEGSILKELSPSNSKPKSQLEGSLIDMMEQLDNDNHTINEAGFWSGLARGIGGAAKALSMSGLGSGAMSAGRGAYDERKFIKTMHQEDMMEYGRYYSNFVASNRTQPSPDDVVKWAKTLYRNDGYEITTPPPDGSVQSVSRWLMQVIISNRARKADAQPQPEPVQDQLTNFPTGPKGPFVGGTTGNVYEFKPLPSGAPYDASTGETGWTMTEPGQSPRVLKLPGDQKTILTLNSQP